MLLMMLVMLVVVRFFVYVDVDIVGIYSTWFQYKDFCADACSPTLKAIPKQLLILQTEKLNLRFNN